LQQAHCTRKTLSICRLVDWQGREVQEGVFAAENTENATADRKRETGDEMLFPGREE
jgi:hypothetical protein